MHRWKVRGDDAPRIAAIAAREYVAGGRAEPERAVARHRERVAIDDVVREAIGEPFGQHVERLAAVARARDDELAVDRDALLVLHAGNEPSGVSIERIDDDGEPERRGPGLLDLVPAL